MEKRECQNCAHWERKRLHNGERDFKIGKCFGQPPNPSADRPFALTYEDERCPHYTEKPEGKRWTM
jgi:hypothetical protein